jgi:hypothetical protein
MNKNWFKLSVAVIALVLILGSCATYTPLPLVVDSSVPEEESAKLFSSGNFYLVAYNGISLPTKEVKMMAQTIAVPDGWNYLLVPAGENTTITGNMYYARTVGRTTNTFEAAGMEFSYIFDAGKSYYVESFVDEESSHFLLSETVTFKDAGVRIYAMSKDDEDRLYNHGPDVDNLLGFVPFTTQPTFKAKGLFE